LNNAEPVGFTARVLVLQRRLSALMAAMEAALLAATSMILVFLVTALFLQVLFRYVIRQPLPWSEEAARYGMIWFAMLAAALAARRGQQIVFRWATLPIPRVPQALLRQVVSLATLVFLVFLLLQSLAFLDVVANQVAPGTGVNMRLPYAGIAVGVAFLIVVYLSDFLDSICSVITGRVLSLRELQELETLRSLAAGASLSTVPEGNAASASSGGPHK